MSRDWSYRVWDKQEKTYSDKGFSIDQYGISYVQDEDGYWEEASARYVFEFSTGLEDMNGKMIREGDIVKCWDEDCGEVYFDKISLQYRVMFGDGDDEDLASAEPEVIGNIHESPKDFRPEHLKRMGVTMVKGDEE